MTTSTPHPLWEKYKDEMIEHITLEQYERLQRLWSQPHRFHHDENHLADILNSIEEANHKLPTTDRVIYLLTAFYHDAIYNPMRMDNEELSIELWKVDAEKTHYTWTNFYTDVKNLIYATKQHNSTDPFIKKFLQWDSRVALTGTGEEIMKWENGIFKEFQLVSYPVYKQLRLQFLDRWERIHPEASRVVEIVKAHLSSWKPRVGVYMGSFKPWHIGHMDVFNQGAQLFDKMIAAQGKNPDKQKAVDPLLLTLKEKGIISDEDIKKLTSTSENFPTLDKVLPFHETREFSGFQNEFLERLEEEGIDPTAVRGLRGGEDLNFEIAQNRYINKLGQVKTVFFLASPGNEFVSSSRIKMIAKVPTSNQKWEDRKKDVLSQMVPTTYDYAFKDILSL